MVKVAENLWEEIFLTIRSQTQFEECEINISDDYNMIKQVR